MAVKIGSARSSYGNTAPGDQTSNGREVSTQDWYLHSKGWVVLRPKDPQKAGLIAYAMQAACDNNLIGYSQETRSGLYNAVKNLKFDPKRCTKACNTDCSALVRVCCLHAGITVGNFTTSGEVAALMKTGAFEKLDSDKYCKSSAYLNKGDILCTRSKGHTVVVLTDGAKAEERLVEMELVDDEDPVATGTPAVEILEGTWNMRTGPGTQYNAIGAVKGGARYNVLGRDNGTGWVCITVPSAGKCGWISPKAYKEV